MNIITERLAKLRTDSHLTMVEAAKEMGISYSTLSAYERGVKIPSIECAQKIAKYYNVPTGWIIGDDIQTLTAEQLVFDAWKNYDANISFKGKKVRIEMECTDKLIQLLQIFELSNKGELDKKLACELVEIWKEKNI